MSEWHVTPDYIVNNWTEELWSLMIQKFDDRQELIRRSTGRPKAETVPDRVLFQKADNLISYKTVKQENNGDKLRGRPLKAGS